jgi:cytochrome c
MWISQSRLGGPGARRHDRRMSLRFLAVFLALLLAHPPRAPAQDLSGHGGPVRALAVLEGRLASAGFDQAVILWDPAAGRALRVIRWHQGAVNALAALPDGRLASAGEDARIALWGPGEAPEAVLEGHTEPVAGLAAAPGLLASAAWDGTVRLWDLATREARVLRGHQGNVNAVAFAGGVLYSTGQDGTLRRWEADGSPRTIAEFGMPQNALLALPDGALASAGVDGTVRLVAPDGAVRELRSGPRPVIALAASPDGRTLAVGTIGGSVGLYALPEGRLRHTLDGPGLPVWSAAFAADGRTLWTGGQDRRVRRWNAANAQPLGPLAAEAAEPALAALDPHGAEVWRACQACHALRPDAPPMAGPHLHRLFGRRMGSVPGYAYSERLARGDIVWTPETVADLFTRGPDVVTPGTRMPVQTVGNSEDMAALIRFLEQATR